MRQLLPVYAALTVALHLEAVSTPLVLLPFLFPPQELTLISD